LTISIPDPELQASFAAALSEIRTLYLQDALRDVVKSLAIPTIDQELAAIVPAHSLTALASHGIRGEMMFPVPSILSANPRLLGYYRLLYGYSKKEFYTAATGLGRYIGMEERGAVGKGLDATLLEVCREMCTAGALLLATLSDTKISVAFLDDLTLLTLGPQLRGGANVRKGSAGIRTVFNAIHEIVQTAVTTSSETRITILNAAGRTVLIEFAADPDIIIREEMQSGQFRQLIAIEVKAGSDFSNIHNRIGEAEKSHQKAKAAGYVECWTVVNVDKVDIAMAHKESPSTNRFYRISDIVAAQVGDYVDFRDRIVSLTGIASP
jgi:XcyI restriction endonuclease